MLFGVQDFWNRLAWKLPWRVTLCLEIISEGLYDIMKTLRQQSSKLEVMYKAIEYLCMHLEKHVLKREELEAKLGVHKLKYEKKS